MLYRLEQERSGAGADRASASSRTANQDQALAEAKQQLRDTLQAYTSCKGVLDRHKSALPHLDFALARPSWHLVSLA